MRIKKLLRLRGKTIRRIDKINKGLVITFTHGVKLTCYNADRYEGDFRYEITEYCSYCNKYKSNCNKIQIIKYKHLSFEGIRFVCKECRGTLTDEWVKVK